MSSAIWSIISGLDFQFWTDTCFKFLDTSLKESGSPLIFSKRDGSGILKKDDIVIENNYIEIKHAYVIFDKFREKILPEIFSYLEKNSIFSVGRYGSWTYASMEDAILKGKEIAEMIRCPK